jgi:hypothetical protein
MEPQFTRVDRLNSIDPDNIYYNLSMTNGNLSGGFENDPQIRFQEARDRPIVRDASKYEMSVIKFNINGASKNLPLLVPQLAPAISATAIQGGVTLTVTTSIPHGLRTSIGGARVTRITLGRPTTGPGTANIDGVYTISVTGNSTFNVTVPVNQNATWTIQQNAVYSYEKLAYTLSMARTAVNGSGAVQTPVYYSIPIYWTPETDAPLIASPPNTMDLSNDYFYVYHYYHWIGLINTTLQYILTRLTTASASSFSTLALAVTALAYNTGTGDATPLAASTIAPRMKLAFNPATKLHSYYASTGNWGANAQAVVNAATTVGPVSANTDVFTYYYNTNFEGLFTNFHNQYTQANVNYEHQFNFNNASDGQINTWLLPNVLPAPGSPYLQGTYDWVITQDSDSTTSLWCPVDAIVFTATGIPVRNEEGSTVTRVGNTTIGGSVGGNGSFGTIISEVTLDQQSASDWRGFVYYQPYAQYQIASLDGSDVEIRNIDIYAWWRSRLNGQLVPLRLYNNGSASMKLLFRRKK